MESLNFRGLIKGRLRDPFRERERNRIGGGIQPSNPEFGDYLARGGVGKIRNLKEKPTGERGKARSSPTPCRSRIREVFEGEKGSGVRRLVSSQFFLPNPYKREGMQQPSWAVQP